MVAKMIIPNMRIVMRDDWIEVEICSFLAGHTMEYEFHSDGSAIKRESGDSISTVVTFYEALSEIADMTADNIQALKDSTR